MARRLLSLLLLGLAACADQTTRGAETTRPSEIASAPLPPDQEETESPPLITHAARCSATDPFDAPIPVAGLERVDGTARFTPDELGVVFSNRRLDGMIDLFQASRSAKTEAFGEATALTGLGSEGTKLFPAFGKDSLTLWFAQSHDTPTGYRVDIASATRADEGASFDGAHEAKALNVFRENTTPFVAKHTSEIWYAAGPSSDQYELFVSTVDGATASKPLQVTELNTEYAEAAPVLSDNGLVIYWSSTRVDGGAKGEHDIWVATRNSTKERFGPVTNVAEINTTALEYPAWVSPDLCRLYIVRGAGPTELLVAERRAR